MAVKRLILFVYLGFRCYQILYIFDYMFGIFALQVHASFRGFVKYYFTLTYSFKAESSAQAESGEKQVKQVWCTVPNKRHLSGRGSAMKRG